jgi:hypothetical protein
LPGIAVLFRNPQSEFRNKKNGGGEREMNIKKSVRSLMSVATFICMIAFLFSCGGGGDDASSGSSSGQSGSITIQYKDATGSLSSTFPSIPANGTSSVIMHVKVTDSAGNPVRHYTEVDFSATLCHFRNGSGNYTVSTQPPLDKDGFPDPTADPTGIVEVQCIAGTTVGTATIIVTSNSVTQSVYIVLTGYVPPEGNLPVGEAFSLSAAYLNISGWWKYSLTDLITATAADINGNAVKDDTVIDFKTYNTGGYVEPDQVKTVAGTAQSTLYSAANPAPSEGFLMLTAETTGDATTRVTSIAAVPYPDQHIMYAGTNGGGVYKSTDSGVTWVTASRSSENPKRGQNLIEPYIKGHNGIAVDPDNHNTVYVGTGYLGKGNVYRSLDGGNNWNSNNTEEWNGIYDTTAAVLAVVVDGDDLATTDYPYVWIGTEGKGALYATDGETFQPSGSYASAPVGIGTGNGTMSDPVVSYTSLSETWTATYVQTAGTATLATFSGTGDGTMSTVTTSTTTKTEGWTVTYAATAGSVTPGAANVGNGSVRNIALTKPNANSETWTLTATQTSSTPIIGPVTGSASTKGSVTSIAITGATETETFTLSCTTAATLADNGVFEVNSDKRGSFGYVTADGDEVTKTIDSGTITLTISKCGTATAELYALGEVFTFTSTINAGNFSVQSSVAGFYPDAIVGTTYTQDGLTFIINDGSTAFDVGDTFTFTTTSSWQATGAVSGTQTNTATTGTAYTSDNSEVEFTITAGGVAFVVGDKFTFATTAGTSYWTVAGSVSGLQTNLAFNDSGYYSDKREVYFLITEGTVAFVSGFTFTFTVTASDIGHGWTVWDIVQVPDTHGATAILYAGTATGVYKSTDGARTWSSTTLFTGDFVVALALYPTATGGSSDTIYAGTLNAGVWVSTDSGTTWTQYTTGMDDGKGASIKDILVDPSVDRLYALAVKGSGESATGDVYVQTLNANGSMAAGGWSKVNTGLSGKALYALAADIPSSPTALFTGGEGINLYEATNGLDTGNPSWASSKYGLSNLLMARMPILFSGECFMTVYQTSFGDGERYYYEIYVEDVNGNPPIEGSTFTAKTYLGTAPVTTYYDVIYPDIYKTPHGGGIHGTFRDPSDGTTNDPYRVWVNHGSGTDRVIFEFTPKCGSEAPGCSGSKQSITY